MQRGVPGFACLSVSSLRFEVGRSLGLNSVSPASSVCEGTSKRHLLTSRCFKYFPPQFPCSALKSIPCPTTAITRSGLDASQALHFRTRDSKPPSALRQGSQSVGCHSRKIPSSRDSSPDVPNNLSQVSRVHCNVLCTRSSMPSLRAKSVSWSWRATSCACPLPCEESAGSLQDGCIWQQQKDRKTSHIKKQSVVPMHLPRTLR